LRSLIALTIAMLLTGCASDYNKYAEMQTSIQTARHAAEAERYKAMGRIAEAGDTTTKVAAMFAMQAAQQSQPVTQLVAPKSASDAIREWVGILIPSIIQGYGIHANQQIATTQSNNSAALGMSTNAAFVGMSGQIQAPAANISTTLSGTGTLGSGSYGTDTHSVTGSYNPAPVDNTNNSNQGNPVTNPVAP